MSDNLFQEVGRRESITFWVMYGVEIKLCERDFQRLFIISRDKGSESWGTGGKAVSRSGNLGEGENYV